MIFRYAGVMLQEGLLTREGVWFVVGNDYDESIHPGIELHDRAIFFKNRTSMITHSR